MWCAWAAESGLDGLTWTDGVSGAESEGSLSRGLTEIAAVIAVIAADFGAVAGGHLGPLEGLEGV